ncbi:hypothetical protein MAPG_11050 [Magnaporthiopsis poae ATCC 64411]|uniref:Uncharacterized protein n=1 Tax=Magnaporthiopsis poae (strain ATCC 64411 / 73-15) TaxID=644358 RepID=A0A0C4EE85_MAGP6|nr:hypothetical protein MAPG_11050 [Magnaporthiopsis poae ATCC 64411]
MHMVRVHAERALAWLGTWDIILEPFAQAANAAPSFPFAPDLPHVPKPAPGHEVALAWAGLAFQLGQLPTYGLHSAHGTNMPMAPTIEAHGPVEEEEEEEGLRVCSLLLRWRRRPRAEQIGTEHDTA